jgi:hypothetical protein
MRKTTFLVSGLLAAIAASGSATAQPPLPSPPGDIVGGVPISVLRGETLHSTFMPAGAVIVRRPATRASISDLQVGRVVRDRGNRYLGRIASVDSSSVVVRFHGDRTAVVPLGEVWKIGDTLALRVTRTDFSRMASLR